MATDKDSRSGFDDQDEPENPIAEAEEEHLEQLTDPERPACPRCGWQDTRLSHTRTMFDPILRAFSLRAFRCRSCGNRFRAIHRTQKA